MKTYVLYHANCPDGAGAALAYATAKTLDEVNATEFVPVNYKQPPPDIEAGAEVYILDFSYPRPVLEALHAKCTRLQVLDHHATAQEALAGLPYCEFDMNRSGAVMAYQHFHPGEQVPEFFLYLQDRDLWQWRLDGSREVSAAISSYGLDWRWWYEHSIHLWTAEFLRTDGAACLRLKSQQVDAQARHQRRVKFEVTSTPPVLSFVAEPIHTRVYTHPLAPPGESEQLLAIVCPVANASAFFSEVGERLLELNPEAPCAAYYFDRGDGVQQWGLRSRPGFDCSVIATAFGGGGHKQAAGFQLLLLPTSCRAN